MSRTLSNPDASNTSRRTMSLVSGGSGQTSASAALAALNGVPNSQYNQANGVVQLDSSGKLPLTSMPDGVSAGVSLTGPTTLYIGAKGVWSITNYDSALSYTLSCTSGFVTRSGDQVYYTAPSAPGTYSFTINGKSVPVIVDDYFIATPNILTPAQDTTNAGSGVTITSSAFTVQGSSLNAVLTAFDKAANDYFGVAVALSADGSRLAVGAQLKDVSGVVDAGQVYVYTRSGSTYTLEATISAADKATNDQFGRSLSFTSDGSRLAVGAWYKDVSSVVDAGQVYVYTRSGSTYTQEAIITASDKVTQDAFGVSVSFTADGSRLAIGANNKTVGGVVGAGQVYTYTRSGSTYTLEATISAADKATSDSYGVAVAFSGDGARLAVGAYAKDVSSVVDAGQVYVYTRSGSTYTQEVTISASDKAANDYFGISVAFTADGSRLAVGAYNKDILGISNCGQVYTYTRSGSTYTLEATISANDPFIDNRYGASVTYNNNGSLLAIGAHLKDVSNIVDCGQVYIYDMPYHASTDWQLSTDPGFSNIVASSIADTTNRTSWQVSDLTANTDYYLRCRYTGTQYGTSEWSTTRHFKTRSSWLPINEVQTITAYDKAVSDSFGSSVSMDSTGTRMIVSSSNKTISGVTGAGKVYICVRSGNTWSLEAELTDTTKVTNDMYGRSVSIDSTGSRVAVGASSKDVSSITDCGQVYTYTRSGTTWTLEATISASDKAIGDFFGVGVALSGDSNRLAVGAIGKNVPTNNEGQVYIYTRSGSTYTLEATITAADRAQSDYFGSSLSWAADGSRLAIGANNKTVGGVVGAGQVYIYTRSGSVYTLEATITASDKAANDNFGTSVSFTTDGSILFIGAPSKTVNGITLSGQVYVYRRTGSTYTEEAKLINSDKATSDSFGMSCGVSGNGTILTVGASGKTVNGITLSGQVYFFA